MPTDASRCGVNYGTLRSAYGAELAAAMTSPACSALNDTRPPRRRLHDARHGVVDRQGGARRPRHLHLHRQGARTRRPRAAERSSSSTTGRHRRLRLGGTARKITHPGRDGHPGRWHHPEGLLGHVGNGAQARRARRCSSTATIDCRHRVPRVRARPHLAHDRRHERPPRGRHRRGHARRASPSWSTATTSSANIPTATRWVSGATATRAIR